MATARQVAIACARACDEKKATEIAVLNIEKQAFFTRFFVICTTRHPRQARAVADAASETAKALGDRELGREGIDDGQWVVVDLADVIVHIFSSDQRAFYDLESLWADAKKVRWKPAAKAKAGSRG